ncbi:Hypothetical protein NTJ_09579 [Nesidiocoris tenuis]|nr:Hypothetical protein NTJ_09579 [Nesidiocoris tenuis]
MGLMTVVGGRLLQILLLCNTCTELTEESEKFRGALSRAMRTQYFPCYNKKLRLYLVTMPSAQISASGLFIVSNSIIPTILTTSMTYTIVLLQLY